MKEQKYRVPIDAEIEELRALSSGSKDARAAVGLDQQSVGRLPCMVAMQQQSMDLAREDHRRARLDVLAAAQRRLAEGDYGYCLGWFEDIPEKRLDNDAEVILCIHCQR